jgi:hypothetical protein
VVPPPAAPAAPVAPGGASSQYISTQDSAAQAQDQASLDQSLSQIQSELNATDQTSTGGENDVPSN